jgi:hypothetical protein
MSDHLLGVVGFEELSQDELEDPAVNGLAAALRGA